MGDGCRTCDQDPTADLQASTQGAPFNDRTLSCVASSPSPDRSSPSDVVFHEVRRRFLRPVRLVPLVVGQQGLCHLMSLGAQLGNRGRLPESALQQGTDGKEKIRGLAPDRRRRRSPG